MNDAYTEITKGRANTKIKNTCRLILALSNTGKSSELIETLHLYVKGNWLKKITRREYLESNVLGNLAL